MELIPSIDLRGGACVRLWQGDFARETRYDLSPVELLRRYRAMGAQWLHLVDLDGARDGRLANRDLIAALAAPSALALQVGGGVRELAVAEDLLSQGIQRVVIGSAAVESPDAVSDWLGQLGAEQVVLAFDVRLDAGGVPRVQIRGWQQDGGIDLWSLAGSYAAAGARHILCTDVARDGALAGPNLALYAEAQRRFPQFLWQASGGIRNRADLEGLALLGVAAAISGRALLEDHLTADDARPWLPGRPRVAP